MSSTRARVAVHYWYPRDGIAAEHYEQVRALGYETLKCIAYDPLPAKLDALMVVGPYGSLVPIIRELVAYAESPRPALIFVLTEQLPRPDLPEAIRYWAGAARSWVERCAYRYTLDGQWQVLPGMKALISKGLRYRYYGDLYWMKRLGVLSTLAVWSHWTADFLRARGFDVIVPAGGYSPDWGEPLHMERDIPVVWLGKTGSRRRKRLLERLRAELRQRDVELLVIDGVERPYVFGPERTKLLNRTKIVLNLVRQKWDDNCLRFCVAAANGAMIVSETMLPHSAFKPGVHLVEAPIDELADTICHYLSNDAEREQIAGRAYELITAQPFGQGLKQMLDKALAAKQ